MANSEAMAERLAAEIRSQESLHSSLLKDLAKVAARNPMDSATEPKKQPLFPFFYIQYVIQETSYCLWVLHEGVICMTV